MDVNQFKRSPLAGNPNVDEVERPDTGERCLCPSEQWLRAQASKPEAGALQVLYVTMAALGVPPPVILTIAAIKLADRERKVDFKTWIESRSNWSQEDKDGAISVLQTMCKEESLGSLPPLEKPAPKKDWSLN